MPNIGEIKKASELGYKVPKWHDSIYVYTMCKQCSRARWVRRQDIISGKGNLCRSCSHTTTQSFRNHIQRVKESGAKRASELGKPVFKNRDPWYYPHICSNCGKQTWHQRKDLNRVCKDCAYQVRKTAKGDKHANWKGGTYNHVDGYIYVQVLPGSPYYSMAQGRGYVLEHRLVVALKIGRPLESWEVVHHINGDKTDNREENLELLPDKINHLPYNLLQATMAKQALKIKLLEWRVKELEQGNPVPMRDIKNISEVRRGYTGGTLDERVERESTP